MSRSWKVVVLAVFCLAVCHAGLAIEAYNRAHAEERFLEETTKPEVETYRKIDNEDIKTLKEASAALSESDPELAADIDKIALRLESEKK